MLNNLPVQMICLNENITKPFPPSEDRCYVLLFFAFVSSFIKLLRNVPLTMPHSDFFFCSFKHDKLSFILKN